VVRSSGDFDCVAAAFVCAMVTLPFLYVVKLMISWPNAAAALPFPIHELPNFSQDARYRGFPYFLTVNGGVAMPTDCGRLHSHHSELIVRKLSCHMYNSLKVWALSEPCTTIILDLA
jgi:hypothetical protein